MYELIQLFKLKLSIFPAVLVKMMGPGCVQRSSPEAGAEAPGSCGDAESRVDPAMFLQQVSAEQKISCKTNGPEL